jgi:diaminopimelate epimerase
MTSQPLRFTKMHGAGNDFVVLDGLTQNLVGIEPVQWRWLAHRQFGVGADQILLVEAPTHPEAQFRYRIFNADGSEVEQCGNGSRCFVRFVRDKGLTRARSIRVQVARGLITLNEDEHGLISVDMGAPALEPAALPFIAEGWPTRIEGQDTLYGLSVRSRAAADRLWLSIVSMGNPHAVQTVSHVHTASVTTDGPAIENHPAFPRKVNAGFMEVLEPHAIRLRVYERGSGETLACGTGACAAVVAGIRRGLLRSPVNVETRGGHLNIEWAGEGQAVIMRGPATTVFEGSVYLPSPSNIKEINFIDSQ